MGYKRVPIASRCGFGDTRMDTDAYDILRDLSCCQHILKTEHREWLRRMYETEWFCEGKGGPRAVARRDPAAG